MTAAQAAAPALSRPCPPPPCSLPGAPEIGHAPQFGGTRRPVDSFELPGAPPGHSAPARSRPLAASQTTFAPPPRTTASAATPSQRPATATSVASAGRKATAPPPPPLPSFPSGWKQPPPPPPEPRPAESVPSNKRIIVQDVPWELLEKLGDLKRQNKDLQEAISEEKETTADAKRSQPRGGTVDLAHLLELVQDFGLDGLGGGGGGQAPAAAVPLLSSKAPAKIKAPAASVQVFSLGDDDVDADSATTASTVSDDDLEGLQQELKASQDEAQRLKAELARRDEELRQLRSQATQPLAAQGHSPQIVAA